MFNDLWKNSVFTNVEQYDEAVIEFKDVFKYTSYAFYIAIIVLACVFTVEISYWKTWYIASLPNSGYYLFLYGLYIGLGWYFVIIMAYREILVVIELSKLFKDRKVQVNIWHPDKIGGLRGLGIYRLNVAIILAIMGLIILIISFPSPYKSSSPTRTLSLWIFMLIIIGPTLYFIPLVNAHNAMKKAKEDLLIEISHKLDAYFSQFIKNTDNRQSIVHFEKNDWDNFQRVIELDKVAAQYPEWPYDLSILGKLFTVILFPVLVKVFELIFFP